MVRFGRAWGLKLGRPSVQGIRFRMGLAMAVALLPILMLSAAQTQAEFQRQAEDRRIDLQLAAERSAADAKARIDSTVVLLQALAPEASSTACRPCTATAPPASPSAPRDPATARQPARR